MSELSNLQAIVKQLEAIDENISKARIATQNNVDAVLTHQLILIQILMDVVGGTDTSTGQLKRLRNLQANVQAQQTAIRKRRES